MTPGGVGRFVGEKGDDRLRGSTGTCHITASARRRKNRNARPGRIGCDKGFIAWEVVRSAFAPQNHPFDDLARQRIGDRAFDRRGFVLTVLADQIDRLFHGGQIERRCRSGRRGGEGWDGPRGDARPWRDRRLRGLEFATTERPAPSLSRRRLRRRRLVVFNGFDRGTLTRHRDRLRTTTRHAREPSEADGEGC